MVVQRIGTKGDHGTKLSNENQQAATNHHIIAPKPY